MKESQQREADIRERVKATRDWARGDIIDIWHSDTARKYAAVVLRWNESGVLVLVCDPDAVSSAYWPTVALQIWDGDLEPPPAYAPRSADGAWTTQRPDIRPMTFSPPNENAVAEDSAPLPTLRSEPLPCPFCGELPTIAPEWAGPQREYHARIICQNDDCLVQPETRFYKGEAKLAIAAWNRRVSVERAPTDTPERHTIEEIRAINQAAAYLDGVMALNGREMRDIAKRLFAIAGNPMSGEGQ